MAIQEDTQITETSTSFISDTTGNTVTATTTSSTGTVSTYGSSYGQVNTPSYRISDAAYTTTFSEGIDDLTIDWGAFDQGEVTISINGVVVDLNQMIADGTATWEILDGTGGGEVSANGTLVDAGGTGSGHTGRLYLNPTEPITSITISSTADASGILYDMFVDASTIVCFCSGTTIETDTGIKYVEDLKKGDKVRTKDHGFKPIQWIGKNTVDLKKAQNLRRLFPVRIRAGALGNGMPEQDLYVSQQHRILVKSKIAARMMAFDEVLVSAKKLLDFDGIEIVEDCDVVTYVHFLFDQHEIVYSNGAETESLFTGPQALKSVSPEAREEILSIFPDLAEIDYDDLVGARIIPSGKIAKKLVSRINKNSKLLYERTH